MKLTSLFLITNISLTSIKIEFCFFLDSECKNHFANRQIFQNSESCKLPGIVKILICDNWEVPGISQLGEWQ